MLFNLQTFGDFPDDTLSLICNAICLENMLARFHFPKGVHVRPTAPSPGLSWRATRAPSQGMRSVGAYHSLRVDLAGHAVLFSSKIPTGSLHPFRESWLTSRSMVPTPAIMPLSGNTFCVLLRAICVVFSRRLRFSGSFNIK